MCAYSEDIWFRQKRKIKRTASGRLIKKHSVSFVYDSCGNKVLCNGRDEKKYYLRQKQYVEEQTVELDSDLASLSSLYNLLVPLYPDNYILSTPSDESCPNRALKNLSSWTSANVSQERFNASMFVRHISYKSFGKSDICQYYGASIFGFRANSMKDKFRYFVYDVDTSKDINENQADRMHEIALRLHNKHYGKSFGSTLVKRVCITNISNQGYQFFVLLKDSISLSEIVENALSDDPDIDNVFPNVKIGFRLPFSRHRLSMLDFGHPRYLSSDDVASFIFDDDAELTIDDSNYDWIKSHSWKPHNVKIPTDINLDFTPCDVVEKIDPIVVNSVVVNSIEEVNSVEETPYVTTMAWKNKAFAASRHFIETGESLTYRDGSNKSLAYNELSLYAKILHSQSHSIEYIHDSLYKCAANRILCCKHKEIEKIVASALHHDNGVTIDRVMQNPSFVRQYVRLMETGVATEYRSSMFMPKMVKYFSSIDVMGLMSDGKQSNRGRKITYDVNSLAELACDVIYAVYSGRWITNRYVAQIVKNKDLNMPSGEEFISKFMKMLRNCGLINRLFRGYNESQKSFYEIGQIFSDMISQIESNIDELANCNIDEIATVKADVLRLYKSVKDKPTIVNQIDLLISVSLLCALIEYHEIVSMYGFREKLLSVLRTDLDLELLLE